MEAVTIIVSFGAASGCAFLSLLIQMVRRDIRDTLRGRKYKDKRERKEDWWKAFRNDYNLWPFILVFLLVLVITGLYFGGILAEVI